LKGKSAALDPKLPFVAPRASTLVDREAAPT
jgi:hypothetical protein